jgi:hypothetical protein
MHHQYFFYLNKKSENLKDWLTDGMSYIMLPEMPCISKQMSTIHYSQNVYLFLYLEYLLKPHASKKRCLHTSSGTCTTV